eukprot:jgi/Picsp_1/4485/NSC_06706-R1_adhesion lipoprotein
MLASALGDRTKIVDGGGSSDSISPATILLVNETSASLPSSPDLPTLDSTGGEAATCTPPLDMLSRISDATVFVWTIKAIGIESIINSRTREMTIFVPTDDAFLGFLNEYQLDMYNLAGQKNTLAAIVRNHIIDGVKVPARNFAVGTTYSTLNAGQALTLVSDISPITEQVDLEACNSIMHKTKIVLVPDFILPLGSQSLPEQSGTGSQESLSSGSETSSTSLNSEKTSVGAGLSGSFTSASGSKGGSDGAGFSGSYTSASAGSGGFSYNAIDFSGRKR